MILIKRDAQFNDEFVVLDSTDNPVTGLTDGNFSKKLYNPDKDEVANISAGIPVTIEELGDGLYRVNFTPDQLGNWALMVYHTTYFPWGKGDNYVCVEALGDDLLVLIRRILGLSQENYRIFSPTYTTNNRFKQSCMTSGIIKTYLTAADCEADTNQIATYEVTATYDNNANMTSYKVKRTS